MFGIANQMLAAIALAIGTVLLVNTGRSKYIWVTLLPMAFVTLTTTTAGVEMITHHFWPANAGAITILINEALIVFILACAYFIFAAAFAAARRSWRGFSDIPKAI